MKVDRSHHPTSLLLKACPFCGEDGTRNDSGLKPELTRVETTAINSPHATEFGVQCGRCGARTIDCHVIETAVERWNARP